MFTGLIEDLGEVRSLTQTGEGARITVATSLPTEEIALGDSIAVNGVCLTAVATSTGAFSADVSRETLQRSNLRSLSPGAAVNLERALRLGDRLGGHLVSGHVDCLATVARRQRVGNAIHFTFSAPAEHLRYIVEKGSVAVDGISLTVNAVDKEGFSLAIIPHTLEMTTLKEKGAGAAVNIETDVIGKYVERLLQPAQKAEEPGGMDLEFLAKKGFL